MTQCFGEGWGEEGREWLGKELWHGGAGWLEGFLFCCLPVVLLRAIGVGVRLGV